MATWETSIFVNRPVEAAFALVCDPTQESTWHRSETITQISDGPIQKGSQYQVSGRFLFWKFKSRTIVSEFEYNRVVTYQSTSGPYPYNLRYDFQPIDGGTRLTETGEAFPPAMMRWAIGLFIGNARRNGERGLRLLKAYLESDKD